MKFRGGSKKKDSLPILGLQRLASLLNIAREQNIHLPEDPVLQQPHYQAAVSEGWPVPGQPVSLVFDGQDVADIFDEAVGLLMVQY